MDDFCKEKGFLSWFETSAKENINIDEAARFLVGQVIQIISSLWCARNWCFCLSFSCYYLTCDLHDNLKKYSWHEKRSFVYTVKCLELIRAFRYKQTVPKITLEHNAVLALVRFYLTVHLKDVENETNKYDSGSNAHSGCSEIVVVVQISRLFIFSKLIRLVNLSSYGE